MSTVAETPHSYHYADKSSALRIVDKLDGLEVCTLSSSLGPLPDDEICCTIPPADVPALVRKLVQFCTDGNIWIAREADRGAVTINEAGAPEPSAD